MDEYIEQLINEWQVPSTLWSVVQNILDEPIPEATKKRLLKPLLPRPVPRPRKRKLEKQKAVLQEFDPLHAVTQRKRSVKPTELLPLVAAKQPLTKAPQFVLLKEVDLMKDYSAVVPLGHVTEVDGLVFLQEMAPNTKVLIEKELNQLGGVMFILVLTAELEKLHSEKTIITMAHFRSDAMPILNQGNIMQSLSGAKAKVMKSLQQFTKEGSGWRLKRCIALHLGIVQYRPFRGRSYIKTPSCIPPRTVINVKNNDNRCFEWAVLSALYPVDYRQHPYRPASYMGHLGELNFTGVRFPVKVSDVTKFEQRNPDLSVNIFGWKSGLYPLHVSKQVGREIDLLLLTDPE